MCARNKGELMKRVRVEVGAGIRVSAEKANEQTCEQQEYERVRYRMSIACQEGFEISQSRVKLLCPLTCTLSTDVIYLPMASKCSRYSLSSIGKDF